MSAAQAPDIRRATDIETLFTHGDAVAFEIVGDGDESWLNPEEEAYVRNAASKRRREFAAGRQCARYALAALGIDSTHLPVGRHRQPIWPRGVVGSITHTYDYCVAVAARCEVLGSASIGVDVERRGRVGPAVLARILRPEEQQQLQGLRPKARSIAATMFFCAKEAFYKAQFPLTDSWVGFQQVSVTMVGDALEIDAATDMPIFDHFIWPVRGRVLERDHHCVAAVTVAAATAPADSASER